MKRLIALLLFAPALCTVFIAEAIASHHSECHGGRNLDMDTFGHTRVCFDVKQVYNLSDYPMDITLATGEKFLLTPHGHVQVEDNERPFDAYVMGPRLFSYVIDETGTLFVMELNRQRKRGRR